MVTSALEDQRRREARRIEAERVEETRRIEAERVGETRRIEEGRVQEAALETYFEQMGELLRQGLRRSHTKQMGELLEQGLVKPQEKDIERIYEEKQLHSLATVRTVLILRGLAPRRKWLLLQFLAASGLINRKAPIVDLGETDMREVILCEYLNIDKDRARRYLDNNADPSKYLSKDDLSAVLGSTDADLDALMDILHDTRTFAVLEEVNLHRANMIKAYLRSVILRGADLGGAYLAEADLIDADLSNAYLGGAWLMEAVLIAANLNMANLNRVSAYGAVLVKADLRGADLYEAYLEEGNLRRADLRGANLSGANLAGADLRNAIGLTQEQLNWVVGNEGTSLPEGLVRPAAWNKSIELQSEIIRDTRLKQKTKDE